MTAICAFRWLGPARQMPRKGEPFPASLLSADSGEATGDFIHIVGLDMFSPNDGAGTIESDDTIGRRSARTHRNRKHVFDVLWVPPKSLIQTY